MFIKRFMICALILTLFLASCTGAEAPALSANIEAWVEAPLAGSTLPMGPVTLVVYASSAEGISYIHIQVNGQSLPAVAAAPLTVDGSSRLVRVDYPWTPPGEGEYLVQAAGVNAAGASGGSGSTRFCIVTCNPANPTSTPAAAVETGTPTPAGAPLQPTPAATTTLTPVSGMTTVQFYANPASINAGSCSTLEWNVTTNETLSVYFSGDLVGASGRYETCPCQSETHTLRVVKMNGSSEDYYATVNVSGSCSLPTIQPTSTTVPPPTIEPSPTLPPPPSDTSGPSINSVNATWYPEGCSLFGRANITDPSGVIWAEFWFNLNGTGWAWIQMNQSGNDWTSQVGIDTFGAPGSLEYKVRTLDSLNNESWSGVSTKNFSYCGD
ncbi:MAG: Ig-like domain-containing protein [Chloroflexi bacterium]|nr:Ig-like domain-containing protein [Chloroflexota bacterium]